MNVGFGPTISTPALGQPAAVGVQQVRGTVQRDGGLAGAGAALDDEHAVVVGADDPVLLGLDGLDDVAHPAGAAGGQRRQQRGLVRQLVVAVAVAVAGRPPSAKSSTSSSRPTTVRQRVRMCRRRRTPSGEAAVAT